MDAVSEESCVNLCHGVSNGVVEAATITYAMLAPSGEEAMEVPFKALAISSKLRGVQLLSISMAAGGMR